MQKRVGIGLLGKGSTNHLHRADVVRAFREKGYQVTFIVREDYAGLLSRLADCAYLPCRIGAEDGWRGIVIRFCESIRHAYPSSDTGRRGVLLARLWKNLRPWILLRNLICLAAARFRICVLLAAWTEGKLFRPELVKGLDPKEYDLLLLLGIGTVNSELEGAVTRWAAHYAVPLAHLVGNYDNLTSKGFRGILPERLFVWGPQMKSDAITFHGIAASRVRLIGSIRYNAISQTVLPDRTEFLSRIGLDPARKTIVFAGFVFDSQYFEILEVYRQLLDERSDCQLIVRLYPNKMLMNSVYIEPLIQYAKTLPRVYVSCADPHYKFGDTQREVLQVEEEELWPVLCHCDVLIDYYSTITIEGAIFDKPCIHMHYLPKTARAYVKDPVPIKFWKLRHNRRILSYGAVDVAHDREELFTLIRQSLLDPGQYAEARKKMVMQECGPLDGLACARLLLECEDLLLHPAVSK